MVDANKVGIENRNAKFLCCTEHCNAEMILCKAGTEEALYKSQKSKSYKLLHIEPIIIAGEWTKSPEGSKHHSECVIH